MGRRIGVDQGRPREGHRPPDVGHAAVIESHLRRSFHALRRGGGAPRFSYLLVEQPSNRMEIPREGAHYSYRPPYSRSCTSFH